MSRDTCHISYFLLVFSSFCLLGIGVKLVGGGSVLNEAYPTPSLSENVIAKIVQQICLKGP